MKNFKTLTILPFLFLFFNLQAQDPEVCNIAFDIKSPAAIAIDEYVNLEFDYATYGEDIRIFVVVDDGNIGTSPSPVFNGSGNASGFFVPISNSGMVNEVEIRVTNEDQSVIHQRYFLPAEFHYGDFGVHLSNFSIPDNGSLLLGDNLEIDFNYDILDPAGVRIFLRPFTDGDLTPGYSASGSALFIGSGSETASFNIGSGTNVLVDEIRVRITNPDQTVVHLDYLVPVTYHFSNISVNDISFNYGPEAFLYPDNELEVSVNYTTTEAGGVRIFARPFTDGALTPGYGALGSPNWPVGTGDALSGFHFDVYAGNTDIDHVRITAYNDDQSVLLLEMFVPYIATWGYSYIGQIGMCPPSPSRIYHDTEVNIDFSYFNDEPVDVRIFARPMTEGALSPNYAAHASPLYPPSGGYEAAEAYFTITDGDVVVDKVRFQVLRDSDDELLHEVIIPVNYVFGEAPPTVATKEVAINYTLTDPYPNPAPEFTQLSLILEETQLVWAELVDVSGRIISSQYLGKVVAGEELVIRFETTDLPGGQYFIAVHGPKFNTARPINR